MRALVDLPDVADEVRLRQVAEHEHVEEAIVGSCFRREPHAAAVVLPVRDHGVVEEPLGSSPSTRTRISALRHLKKTSTSATKKLAFSHRLRLRVRAPRDRRAHAGAADVREVLRRLDAGPRAERDLAEVDLARTPVAATRAASPASSGSRRCAGSPSPSRASSARPRCRGRRSRSPPRGTRRHPRPRRVARRRRPPPYLRARSGARGSARSARRRRAPRPAAMCASWGQRLPVGAVRRRRVDEEDGLANGRSPCAARAASSGRPRFASLRRRCARTRPRRRRR